MSECFDNRKAHPLCNSVVVYEIVETEDERVKPKEIRLILDLVHSSVMAYTKDRYLYS